MEKKITLQGPFTDDDVRELMQAVRIIERRQPERNFIMLIDSDDDVPLEDLRKKLLDQFPALEGQSVWTAVVPKKGGSNEGG